MSDNTRLRNDPDIFHAKRESDLEFCNEPNCYEFAQTADPTAEDTRLFKCPRHAAEAAARGDTGIRAPVPSEFNNYTRGDPEVAIRRNAEIQAALAKGEMPAPKKPDHTNPATRPAEKQEAPREEPKQHPAAAPVGPSAKPNPPTERKSVMPMGRAPRRVRCIETGKIYASAKEAAAAIGKHHSGCSPAINNNREWGGFHWAWASDDEVEKLTPAAREKPRQTVPESAPVQLPPGKIVVRPEVGVTTKPSDALVAAEAESLPGRLLGAISKTVLGSGIRGLQVDDFSMAVVAGGIRTQVSLKEFRISVTEVSA